MGQETQSRERGGGGEGVAAGLEPCAEGVLQGFQAAGRCQQGVDRRPDGALRGCAREFHYQLPVAAVTARIVVGGTNASKNPFARGDSNAVPFPTTFYRYGE